MTYDQLKQEFLASLPKFIGYDGMLSYYNGDQGDTLQLEGTMLTLLTLLNDPDLEEQRKYCEATLLRLQASPGYWRRSNNPSFWGFDPRGVSRDNLNIAKQGLMVAGRTKEYLMTTIRQLLRATFHQNYYDINTNTYHFPDIMVPWEWGLGVRAFLGPLSWLVTWVTDLSLGVDLLLRNASKLNQWSADMQLAQNLLVANHHYNSITAWWLMGEYKKTDFMQRLYDYLTIENGNNGCLPLYYLYKMAFLRLEGYESNET